ncbi:hypothetical protein CEXT_71451 [Caerostris extrusa]|uniref:Uncharacterized protein n=1 Tax=Caerostris extrusa TaxID=172846 RepID=A0AAV4XCV8_CAEEX|nr:hypothetical protein CEXT_71451 [Caerostris extrusa]
MSLVKVTLVKGNAERARTTFIEVIAAIKARLPQFLFGTSSVVYQEMINAEMSLVKAAFVKRNAKEQERLSSK